MKRTMMLATTLLLALTLATPGMAEAKQTGKTRFAKQGTWTVAGDLYFNYNSMSPDKGSGDVSDNEFKLAPMLGWFVMNGLELRLGPTLMFGSNDDGVTETDRSEYGAKLGAKYYFPLGGTLFLNAGAAFGYSTGSVGDLDTSGLDIDLGAGLTLVFGSKFGGFASLDAIYTYQTRTKSMSGNDADYTGNNFGIGTTFGVFF